MEQPISCLFPQAPQFLYAKVAATNVPSLYKSNFSLIEPKSIHKIIIKSKTPGLTAKIIVSKSIHSTKDKLHLSFNREAQNSSFIIASKFLSDIIVKNKLKPLSELEIIESHKHNPQLMMYSLPTDTTKEEITEAILHATDISSNSVKIIPYSHKPSYFSICRTTNSLGKINNGWLR